MKQCFAIAAAILLSLTNGSFLWAQDSQTRQIVFFSIPVGTDRAPILASPSNDSYQTGTIDPQERVEVYFCNENGYCAIRPPQGSFSWINGRFLETETASVARVVATNGKAIPSRVGGESPMTSSVVQIGLRDGQKVKTLEKLVLSDGSEWYKIAPPPGEFRWIHKNFLVDDPALKTLPNKPTSQEEYVASLQEGAAKKIENDDQELTFTLDVSELDDRSVENERKTDRDEKSFKQEVARLNGDVFQAVQATSTSNDDFERLSLRAEELFDSAPDDNDRFLIQSIYSILKKTQKERANIARREAFPYPNNAIAPSLDPARSSSVETGNLNNVQMPPTDATFAYQQNNNKGFSNGFQIPLQPNAQNMFQAPVQQLPGQNIFAFQGTPYPIQGDASYSQLYQPGLVIGPDSVIYPNDRTFNGTNVSYGGEISEKTTDNANTASKRSHMTFAFAPQKKANAPQTAKAGKSARRGAGRMRSSLETLPLLAHNGPAKIVPPSNYTGIDAAALARAQSSSNAPNVQKKIISSDPVLDITALASAQNPASGNVRQTIEQSQTIAKRINEQSAPVFQAPDVNSPLMPVNRESATAVAAKQSVRTQNDGNTNMIAQTSNVESSSSANVVPKIRQTNTFEPMATNNKDDFDAYGILAAIANAPKDAPKYAIFAQTQDGFRALAYLDVPKNIDLAPLVGRTVGVRGGAGMLKIDGVAQKLVIVKSVVPQD